MSCSRSGLVGVESGSPAAGSSTLPDARARERQPGCGAGCEQRRARGRARGAGARALGPGSDAESPSVDERGEPAHDVFGEESEGEIYARGRRHRPRVDPDRVRVKLRRPAAQHPARGARWRRWGVTVGGVRFLVVGFAGEGDAAAPVLHGGADLRGRPRVAVEERAGAVRLHRPKLFERSRAHGPRGCAPARPRAALRAALPPRLERRRSAGAGARPCGSGERRERREHLWRGGNGSNGAIAPT